MPFLFQKYKISKTIFLVTQITVIRDTPVENHVPKKYTISKLSHYTVTEYNSIIW